MGNRWIGWAVLAAGVAAGCRHSPTVPLRPPPAPQAPPALPTVEPVPPAFDLRSVPKADTASPRPPEGLTFRGLTEPECRTLAARNSSTANQLDDEDRVPAGKAGCESAERTRREVRHFTALEFRNQSAAAALERFFQLADAEGRTAIAREAFPVFDEVREKAAKAKAANVRFPLDVDDIDRQRAGLLGQFGQAEATVAVLNIDLRRRVGLPFAAGERLWPTGDFGIDPTPVDPDAAVATALARRPELRAWRALYLGLNADTLPTVRDLLRGGNPLVGGVESGPPTGLLLKCVFKVIERRTAPDPAAVAAELEVRRRQLWELTAERERQVADETRAAAVALDAHAKRVALARDRADAEKARLDDAVKKREAGLPGSDLAEAQARLEWVKARGDLIAEVMAWHQARIRLLAAQGLLAPDEAAGPACPPR